jgi:uroporphyrinogen-III synthase
MRVVVTRPTEQAGPLADRIEALGHEVVLCPLIEIEPLGDESIDLTPYEWVLVTSANGAHELARRRRGVPKQLAAIGPGTAEVLREHGLEPDLVPKTSTQEGLAAALPRPTGPTLLAAAEGARSFLVDELGAEFLPLYRTRELDPAPPAGDIAILASASAARVLGKVAPDLPAVSIGPETTRAAQEAGIEVICEADPHTLDGLVTALAEAAVRLPPCSSPS